MQNEVPCAKELAYNNKIVTSDTYHLAPTTILRTLFHKQKTREMSKQRLIYSFTGSQKKKKKKSILKQTELTKRQVYISVSTIIYVTRGYLVIRSDTVIRAYRCHCQFKSSNKCSFITYPKFISYMQSLKCCSHWELLADSRPPTWEHWYVPLCLPVFDTCCSPTLKSIWSSGGFHLFHVITLVYTWVFRWFYDFEYTYTSKTNWYFACACITPKSLHVW